MATWWDAQSEHVPRTFRDSIHPNWDLHSSKTSSAHCKGGAFQVSEASTDHHPIGKFTPNQLALTDVQSDGIGFDPSPYMSLLLINIPWCAALMDFYLFPNLVYIPMHKSFNWCHTSIKHHQMEFHNMDDKSYMMNPLYI